MRVRGGACFGGGGHTNLSTSHSALKSRTIYLNALPSVCMCPPKCAVVQKETNV